MAGYWYFEVPNDDQIWDKLESDYAGQFGYASLEEMYPEERDEED